MLLGRVAREFAQVTAAEGIPAILKPFEKALN
jgi:hypothetical protein